jgi:hypothetical protein
MVGCTLPKEPYGDLDTGRGVLRLYCESGTFVGEVTKLMVECHTSLSS